jgi:cell division protein FtsA
VLTGGTSNLPAIDSLGRELLHMPVRVGAPLPIHGISDNLTDPAFSTAVGLLLWGAKPKNVSSWKSRSFGGNVVSLVSRIKSLFGKPAPNQ